ncbi:unnamed protein product [Camellia sinensis]
MIHLEEGPGDILVFLTGQEKIEYVEKLVQESLRQLPKDNRKLKVLPIFSSLPSEKQMQVFMLAPTGFRKVILATNIAETSVTIPGIKYVIDPGLLKAPTYCARTGMESLIFVPTSKFAKEVGREGPGKCFRLYPEIEFEKLRDSTIPEITRCNLSNVILQLKALGVDDIFGFDFMEKPSRDAVIKSLEILVLLDAITEEYKLSDPVGHQMAWLPLKPIHSKALILASQFNCLEEMLITVAMLSVESIFYAPREKLEEAQTATKCFSSLEGDHLILINIYRAFDEFLEKSKIGINKEKAEKSLRKWCKENFINNRFLRHAREIHRQIQRNVEQMGLHITSCEEEMLQYRRCLAAACFINAALKQPDGTYSPECIIFDELERSSRGYLFGSGEAPKPATNNPKPASSEGQDVNNGPPPKTTAASQQVDVTKQIPTGINSSTANKYFRADGQNGGNFITDRPSTKIHSAPGGGSSLGYLFGDGGGGN